MPRPPRCRGVLKGTTLGCWHRVTHASGYCWQHRDQQEPGEKGPLVNLHVAGYTFYGTEIYIRGKLPQDIADKVRKGETKDLKLYIQVTNQGEVNG